MIARSVTDAGAALAATIEEVRQGGPVVLTEGGEPVAAIVSLDDYRWLEEAEDRWLSGLVEQIEAEPDYDPNDRMPAEEFFRQLLDEDERRGHAAG